MKKFRVHFSLPSHHGSRRRGHTDVEAYTPDQAREVFKARNIARTQITKVKVVK